MSIRRRRGLVLAMEEMQDQIPEINDTEPTVDPEVEDPQPEQPATEPIVFPGAEETPEAREVDVQSAEDEVVAVEEQIEDAQDVIDQIGQVSEIVDQGKENGGLDQTGAQLLTATLESLYARVGLQVNGRVTPAIEEFGSVSGRLRSTSIAVEDMKEKIKVITTKVIQALQVLWEKFQQFLTQVFNQAERYKARAQKLKDIAPRVSDTRNTEIIEDSAIGNALSVDGKVASVAEGLSRYSDVINNVQDSLNEASKFVGPELDKIVAGALQADNRAGLESVTGQINALTTRVAKTVNLGMKGSNEGDSHSPVLLGGVTFTSHLNDGKASFEMQRGENENNVVKMKVLDKNEVAQILDNAISLCDNVLKLKETAKSISGATSGIIKSVKRVNSQIQNKDGGQEQIGSMISSIRQVASYLTNAPRLLSRQSLTVVAASLSYCEKSLRAYQKEKQEQAQPEAQPA